MLAESIEGLHLLAVADYYWGSHENLYKTLQKEFSVRRVLWAGELLLENPAPEIPGQPALGSRSALDQDYGARIVLSINTSGFSWNNLRYPRSPHLNDPLVLKQTIDEFKPGFGSEFSQHLTYSSEHAHLDPLFQELHTRSLSTPTDTVRHRFRNILGLAFYLTHYFTKNPSYSLKNELDIMNKISTESANDIFMFLDSRARYSRDRSVVPFPEGDSVNSEGRVQRDFKTLMTHIQKVGVRDTKDENAEILVLNPQ